MTSKCSKIHFRGVSWGSRRGEKGKCKGNGYAQEDPNDRTIPFPMIS